MKDDFQCGAKLNKTNFVDESGPMEEQVDNMIVAATHFADEEKQGLG